MVFSFFLIDKHFSKRYTNSTREVNAVLDNKDLEILQTMMTQIVAASESRMSAKIEESIAASESRMSAKIDESIAASESRMSARIDESIAASESRMSTKIDESIAASESRMMGQISASESRIMAYIESDILPRFDKLADGHKLLLETLAPKSRVEELEEEIAFLKPLVMSMLTDIDKLKKAQ